MGRKRRGGGNAFAGQISSFFQPDGINYLPIQELSTNVVAGRVCQTLFEGGSYLTFKPLLFNRFTVRTFGITIAGARLVIAVYQTATGLTGSPPSLVGTFINFPVIDATPVLSPVGGGNISLVPGIYFILWGRVAADGGSFSSNCFSPPIGSPLNINRAPQFTTAVAATVTPPATFDPSITTPASPTAVALTCRLSRV